MKLIPIVAFAILSAAAGSAVAGNPQSTGLTLTEAVARQNANAAEKQSQTSDRMNAVAASAETQSAAKPAAATSSASAPASR